MHLFETLLMSFFLCVGSLLIVGALRFILHTACFREKSKTAQRKIKKDQPWWEKVLLFYTLKYEHRAFTVWSLICYHVFCVCSIILVLTPIISYVFEEVTVFGHIMVYAAKVWRWTLLVYLLSILPFMPRKKERKRTT